MTRSEDIKIVEKGQDRLTTELKAVEAEQQRLESAVKRGAISHDQFQKEWSASQTRIKELIEMIGQDEDILQKLTRGKDLSPSQHKHLKLYHKQYSNG